MRNIKSILFQNFELPESNVTLQLSDFKMTFVRDKEALGSLSQPFYQNLQTWAELVLKKKLFNCNALKFNAIRTKPFISVTSPNPAQFQKG